MAASIDDRLLTVLPAALAAIDRATDPVDEVELTVRITAATALFGGDMAPGAKDDFIDQATEELRDMPGSLVLDAIKRARRHITLARLFVPWICADVDPRWDKLKVEAERIRRIAQLAGVQNG